MSSLISEHQLKQSASNVTNTDIELSIGVAVYNVKTYLRECLDSLCKQTFKNAEFIVVDDGSTDGSSAICDEYTKKDSRFKIIHHGVNKGSLLARKTAITSAKGKYMSFIDGDDYYTTSESLASMYELISKNDVDILRYGIECFGEKEDRVVHDFSEWAKHKFVQNVKFDSFYVLNQIFNILGGAWCIWLNVYKIDILKKVAQDCPDEHLICAEDVFLSFLAIYHAKSYMEVESDAIYSYRVGPGISTCKISLQKYTQYAKEVRIICWLNQILTKDSCPSEYFDITDSLLKRLMATAVWRIKALPQSQQKEAFDLLAAEGFVSQMVTSFSEIYRDMNESCKFAQSIYGAKAISNNNTKKTKTIAVLYWRYFCGGVERVISLQIPILISLGYRVVLITETINTEQEYPLPKGVIREVIPHELNKGRLSALEQALEKYQIDTVLYHQGSSWELLWDVLTIKLKRVKVITTLHESVWQDYAIFPNAGQGSFDHARPYIYRLVDKLLVLSRAFVPYFETYGCNVQLMPNPLTFDLERVAVAPLSMRDGVLWLGRLQEFQKHWHDALEIMRRLVQAHSDLQCFIAGSESDPNSVQILKDFILNNKLEDNIHWLGNSHNVKHLLSTSRVLLLTSSFEAFPMTLNEAKVCGTPVVTYDIPYIELLQNHSGCEVVNQRDIDGAIKAVEKILQDDDYAEQMIIASRKSIEDYYSKYNLKTMWRSLLENSKEDCRRNNIDNKEDRRKLLQNLFEVQINHINIGIERLGDCIRDKDRVINDKDRVINDKDRVINDKDRVINDKIQDLQKALTPKRYKLSKVIKYAIKGKWSFSRSKRNYYRNKLHKIFTKA